MMSERMIEEYIMDQILLQKQQRALGSRALFFLVLLLTCSACGRPILHSIYETRPRSIVEMESCVLDSEGQLNFRVKLSDVEPLVFKKGAWDEWARKTGAGQSVILARGDSLSLGQGVWVCDAAGTLPQMSSPLTHEDALTATIVLVSEGRAVETLGERDGRSLVNPYALSGQVIHPRDIRESRSLLLKVYQASSQRRLQASLVQLGRPDQIIETPPVPNHGVIKSAVRYGTYPLVYGLCFVADALILYPLAPLTGGGSLVLMEVYYSGSGSLLGGS